MKKRNLFVVFLILLSLLAAACSGGKKPEATTSEKGEQAGTLASESKAGETSGSSSQTPSPSPRAPIKAEADSFQWPEAASESDFEFDADKGTLTKYLGKGGVIVIPDKIGGKAVKTLGTGLFYANNTITHVKIPEGVSCIEDNGIYFCEKLEAVSLPSSLEAIDPYVFFACSSLKKITFPASLSYIGASAFSSCTELKQISFLGEKPLLGEGAFLGLPEAVSIRVADEEKEAFEAALGKTCTAEGACNYVKRIIPESDWEVDAGSGSLTGYTGDAVHLLLPEKVAGVEIKAIGEKAFMGKSRPRRIELPKSLLKIEKQAFAGASFVDVSFQEGLQEIGPNAFNGCRLIDLHLPKSLTRIDEQAFFGAPFKILHIPENVTEITKDAFKQGSLTEVYLPASIKKIASGAFAKNKALEYLILAGNKPFDIASDAFSDCPLVDIDIAWDASREDAAKIKETFIKLGFSADSLNVWRSNLADQPPWPASESLVFDEQTGLITSCNDVKEKMVMFWAFTRQGTKDESIPVVGLGPGVFEKSKIKRFYVPRSNLFTTIGESAFAGSELEYIDLFDSVTTIGKNAFQNCRNLKEITIPDSVTSIDETAFSGCVNLEKVTIKAEKIKLRSDVFKDCAKLQLLELPAGSSFSGPIGLEAEKLRFAKNTSDEQLAAFAKELAYPWYMDALRVGEKERFVKMPAQHQPNAASDFDFNKEIATIQKYTGSGGVVVIPREIDGVEVKTIGFSAFSNLTIASMATGKEKNETLKAVIIPETVRLIEDSAFLACSSLEKIECYGPLDRLGNRSFEDCGNLKEALFYNGVKEMDLYCFNLTAKLEKVDFAGKLKKLPEGAFYGSGFSGELKLDYEEIGTNAFTKCSRVTTLRIAPSVQKIGLGAFQEMTALKKAYFEKPDATILGESEFQFSDVNKDLKIVLPKSATDEQVAAFVTMLKLNLFNDAEKMVIKE